MSTDRDRLASALFYTSLGFGLAQALVEVGPIHDLLFRLAVLFWVLWVASLVSALGRR